MSIMCSAVTATGLVTFDLDIDSDGRPIYIVSCWNGKEWQYSLYRHFKPAHKAFKLVSKII